MRRSLLFIPSNTPAMLQNADVFHADAVIFDIEDAVSIDQKDAARHLLNQYLKQFNMLKLEKIVRINSLDTLFYKSDVDFILSDAIDTIMLPKATVQTVNELSKLLSRLEKHKKMHKKIAIIPIIELATSLIEVDEIARMDRVNGLLLGAEDLATDFEVERTEMGHEIFYARSKIIVAAKANKMDAIDTPYTNTTSLSGLIKDATFAKSIGMNAKACIHPNQIDDVNRIFSPTETEINYAMKVLTQAKHAQKGAFAVDGKMIDKPILERCQKMIDKAIKWGLIDDENQ